LASKRVVTLLTTAAAVICVIAGFMVGVFMKERDRSKPAGNYNALFNVSPSGEIGFWIYSERGGCPDLRARDRKPLVFVTPSAHGGPGRIEVRELRTCMELRLGSGGEPQMIRCVDGFLAIGSLENASERSGSYSVLFADGGQRSGEFRAVMCEPSG